jgi:hypothetical protein
MVLRCVGCNKICSFLPTSSQFWISYTRLSFGSNFGQESDTTVGFIILKSRKLVYVDSASFRRFSGQTSDFAMSHMSHIALYYNIGIWIKKFHFGHN